MEKSRAMMTREARFTAAQNMFNDLEKANQWQAQPVTSLRYNTLPPRGALRPHDGQARGESPATAPGERESFA